MASLFFKDYFFPSELYEKDSGSFTTPVQTLIDFAPHILQELPKKEKDQKPIKSSREDTWTKESVKARPKSYFRSLLTSDTSKTITEFVIRCGNEYLRQTSERNQDNKYRNRHKEKKRRSTFWRQDDTSSSSEEEEEEEEKNKAKSNKDKEDKKKDDQLVTQKDDKNNTLVKSVAAAGFLSFSLYSTYKASAAFSEISFHNQLEILLSQVQAILQSTDIWIREHEKLGDKVPNQVRSDVAYLKELVDFIERLDPRSHKKMETAGWGCGALGGLSALGGIVVGSTAIATGGAALAIGGAIVMISSKAQGSSKSTLGARLLLEGQVRDRVSILLKDKKERQRVIQHEFDKQSLKSEPKPIPIREEYIKEPKMDKQPPKKAKIPLSAQ
ncbi:hypothetical protein G6F70_008009 [Rhizopus microsporus]|uniref:Uncharacterized protein n=2 Tax=Rhizopus TaxID=4842 RepID=A0A367JC56_RHIAZ|nr:hypothetical protein G6F71_006502 [Rhizopus microsporus]RCH87486.1 hypothetical protein CU097_010360 [Rhizopus azygosporus]KAG1195736.1 hypothetical protein G6F70_008009 [Rhizopus microsporus]KAG1208112.1 hypothetical protein G6F69_007497 [Rhizopus microsporus]KAG1228404.1 hypothetical protein G6F67_007841 [Rhizopus microsporus]